MRPVSILLRPFNLFLLFSVAYFSWSAFASVEGAPGSCSCRFSHKDYDAEKGTLMYYQTEPYGNFSAAKSSIPEVHQWAAQSCL